VQTSLLDNGGRRLGVDRREFSYTLHIPERRQDEDRRTGPDRRNRFNQRSNADGKREMDREWNVRVFLQDFPLKRKVH
jgi:hypothetical protein